MTIMTHEGYNAIVEYDAETASFYGEVLNLRDVITFQGQSVKELKTALVDSIDDYIAFCRERDQDPETPVSGPFF